MAKRASTGLSLCVGIDKPAGMTSHDVVDAVRRVYGERRVGHMGTLDPDATGVLAVCVGPATRLDRYLTGHAKSYVFDIVFGVATDTDDSSGQVVQTAPVPAQVLNHDFASRHVAGLVGVHSQLPPAYSAISKDGVRSYAAARQGRVIELDPRAIEIHSADLVAVGQDDDGHAVWTVAVRVSAGAYVRSIARDTGRSLGTCAHVGALRRTEAGLLRVGDCLTLEQLAEGPFKRLLDPVRLLGMRVLFAEGPLAKAVANGNRIDADGVQLAAYASPASAVMGEECASGLVVVPHDPLDGERIAVVSGNKLAAIYCYDAAQRTFKSECGFATGVSRVADL